MASSSAKHPAVSRLAYWPLDVALLLDLLLALWGLGMSLAWCWMEGWWGNYFAAVWVCGFAGVMSIQAALVLHLPRLVTQRRARYVVWLTYAAFMLACAVVIVVGYAVALQNIAPWVALWFLPPPVIIWASVHHQRHARALPPLQGAPAGGAAGSPPHAPVLPTVAPVPVAADHSITSHQPSPPPAPRRCCCVDGCCHSGCCGGRCCRNGCCRGGCRGCCIGFRNFLGWSSIFWLSVLGFFLALQAAWLAADYVAFPPPGQLYPVLASAQDAVDATGVDAADIHDWRPRLHILCKGPTDGGLSTFVLEAGGGSPGIASAGIADALAAAGRRACWYDRQGYGWSDDSINPTHVRRTPHQLNQLLAAAGERPPFVIVGHSVGGQLALQYAGLYPDDVSGLALLDSYNSAAIDRQWGGRPVNTTTTLANGTTITNTTLLVTDTTAAVVPMIDLLRAATPLAWARLITGASKPDHAGFPYGAPLAALYGGNKVWQAQWVDVLAQVKGERLDDDLTRLGNATIDWNGVSWPTLGAKPALVLPAASTLGGDKRWPLPCDALDFASNETCQAEVLAKPMGYFYAQLALAYRDTLSSDTSLEVMTGDHGYPQEHAPEVAARLLARFSGV